MLINELPDDCMLAIFDQFNNLHHLMACYKVCLKWSHLIAKRAKKVKYFIDWPDYSPDYVFYEDRDLIDVAGLRTLFPNLIIAKFSDRFQSQVKFEDIAAFVRKHEPLKEMITSYRLAMEECCDKLEMLATDCSKPGILQNCIHSKQLSIRDDTLVNFKSDAQYLPNLERLLILINGSYLNGSVLEKLKVVIMHSNVCNLGTIFYGFQFMDLCPNLQSARITMDSRTVLVDETLKNESLQDLVIHFDFYDRDWNVIKRVLMKYPNLKHLALRNLRRIIDDNIEKLVHFLPNLVIFDVRGCRGVTQRAANFVQNYFERNGRSTKFYFKGNHHECKSDWPQLYTKRQEICRGFDFMERFFLEYRLGSDV
ncbi:uncharacterized protein LOC107361496 isoform X3 [Tetranychus urticae]|uniref:uncharacterized protein LOC107361496 isoform X3 n=1 Tax=Tetranychus urticae TaxID=32264 RepID=UPI00077B960C|nr:uncharacterized protein LOC107361496 isoform X3 [Tetranychus urticae]